MNWAGLAIAAGLCSTPAWAGGSGPRPDAVAEATQGSGVHAPVRGQSTASVVTTTFPVVLDFTSDPDPVAVTLELPQPTAGDSFISTVRDPDPVAPATGVPLLLYPSKPGFNIQLTRSQVSSSYSATETPPSLRLFWRCNQTGSYNSMLINADGPTSITGTNACNVSFEYYFQATTTATTRTGYVQYLVSLQETDGSPAAHHGVYINFPMAMSLSLANATATVTTEWSDTDGALTGAPAGMSWDAESFRTPAEANGGVIQTYANEIADVTAQVTGLTTTPSGGTYGSTELYAWIEYCSTGAVLSSCSAGNVLYGPGVQLDLSQTETAILIPNDLDLFPGVLNGEVRYFAKAPADQVAVSFTATVTFTVLGAL